VPELPDVVNYVEAMRECLVGQRLERIVLRSPFVLRSVDPPIDAAHDRLVLAVSRNRQAAGDRARGTICSS
jgi:formamidopyrimidine-DNA glycosylase